MKIVYHVTFLLLLGQLALAQNPNFNLEFISNIIFQEESNDVWGYVDTAGNEYAVMGTRTATVIFDLANPASPQQIVRIDGTPTAWRDMKSWQRYIYSVCDECPDGLLIIDMLDPLNPVHKFATDIPDQTTGMSELLGPLHNIFIDEFGFLYGVGGDLNDGGIVVMDLNNDPWNPVIVGYGDPRYSHDIYVRDNRIYSSDIIAGFFSIVDATDKRNLQVLATHTTSKLFTHNSWLSDDGNTLYTTDEVDFSYLGAYDIRDLSDIKRLDQYRPPSTADVGVTPHNTHIFNDYAVTSWYTDGLKIIDAQYPDNLVEVASFDTWNGPSGGTVGNWGAYPFLPSGIVLISDISTGLYVLQPTYKRASYLEGNVFDRAILNNIPDVQIDILGSQPNESNTNNFGNYKTGIAQTGRIDVRFSHPLYRDTLVNVPLQCDSITFLNVAMTPRFQVITVGGSVVDVDGNGVADVDVDLLSTNVNYTLVTDADGDFFGQVFDQDFEIRAGKWGYGDTLIQVGMIASIVDIRLPGLGENYTDRFVANQGWQEDNNAKTGSWERGIPLITNFQGPLNPGNDSPNDFGDDCYGTALVGTTSFDFDVDGEFNTLTSPRISLAGDETHLYLDFDYWFRSISIGEPTADTLKVDVHLDNVFVSRLASITSSDTLWQTSSRLDLLSAFDFWPVTGDVQCAFVIGDQVPGNPLEAAVDNIKIEVDRMVATSTTPITETHILVYPNPVLDVLTLDLTESETRIQRLRLTAMTGAQVMKMEVGESQLIQLAINLSAGLYTLELIDEDGQHFIQKIIHLSK